jgi:FlaA1/EpsC-like NDP-sugar epimerase
MNMDMRKNNVLKVILLMAVDAVLINVAYILAYNLTYLRFDVGIDYALFKPYLDNIVIITVIKIFIYYLFRLYNTIWKYAGSKELIQIILASIVSNSIILSYFFIIGQVVPRSIFIIVGMIDILFIGGTRYLFKVFDLRRSLFKKETETKRVMIIGAGDAGAAVIRELRTHQDSGSKPVIVIDDDIRKKGQRISGLKVAGSTKDIEKTAAKKRIDEIIIAIPSAKKKEIKRIVTECNKTKCQLKTLPSLFELIEGEVSINQIREVKIEDLLGREEVNLDLKEISDFIRGRRIMITGAGGSIGSELCRQIASYKPEQIILLDIYENNLYDLQNELRRRFPQLEMKSIIASIRDRKRIFEIFEKTKPQIVFHAAAHKHVPLMEENPQEAIKNNVFGTLNLIEAADEYEVSRFVQISTDKAVNPTNIMGASKRICEMLIQAYDKKSKTEYVAVRFGNVLGSNGSVIPLFKKQIANGGPVTLTHEEITRFFMTIPEAVQLVLQSGSMAKGGEIFVLDMGEPVKIIDLAEELIKLSGFEPYEDIDIKIIGLRPGEKLYEELLMDEEGIQNTKYNKIYIGEPQSFDVGKLKQRLKIFDDMTDENIKEKIKSIVTTYENGQS